MESPASNSKKKMTNGHRSSAQRSKVNGDANWTTDLQKSIMEISQISGPSYSANFRRVKGPGKGERKLKVTKGLVRHQRNLQLVESSESESESGTKSSMSDEFVEDYELIAEMRETCGGVNFSNRTMERNWQQEKMSDEAAELPEFSKEPGGFKKSKSMNEKFAKNACITSLLKRQEETAKNVGDTKSSNLNFARDPTDPDFYYRLTKVTDEDIDFTVEHVGKKTIVRPKKYVMENIDDDEFNFVKRKNRPAEKSEKPEKN